MHSWKLSHFGWHAQQQQQQKMKKNKKRSNKNTNGGLIHSVITIIHNYSIYSLNCTHRLKYKVYVLTGLPTSLCSILCFALIFIWWLPRCMVIIIIIEFVHVQSVAFHFISTVIHVPPHVFISTLAPIFNWYGQRIYRN